MNLDTESGKEGGGASQIRGALKVEFPDDLGDRVLGKQIEEVTAQCQ